MDELDGKVVIPRKEFDAEAFHKMLLKRAAESHDERVAAMKVRPSLNLDEERVRDAIQREAFWRAQPKGDHRNEELAHALFQQGKIDAALELAKNPERRAHYESIGFAILKDDNTFCACPEQEDVAIDGKKQASQFWHQVGAYPSLKHGGRMTPIMQCAKCGDVNITNEG